MQSIAKFWRKRDGASHKGSIDIQNYPESEEAFYYRGLVYQARGQLDAARTQFRRALEYNPNFELAQQALDALGN